jgi:hypothetical protein
MPLILDSESERFVHAVFVLVRANVKFGRLGVAIELRYVIVESVLDDLGLK